MKYTSHIVFVSRDCFGLQNAHVGWKQLWCRNEYVTYAKKLMGHHFSLSHRTVIDAAIGARYLVLYQIWIF